MRRVLTRSFRGVDFKKVPKKCYKKEFCSLAKYLESWPCRAGNALKCELFQKSLAIFFFNFDIIKFKFQPHFQKSPKPPNSVLKSNALATCNRCARHADCHNCSELRVSHSYVWPHCSYLGKGSCRSGIDMFHWLKTLLQTRERSNLRTCF